MAAGGGERGGEDLKAGDELLLSYGPRLAEELLHIYGFLPEPIAGNGQGTNTRTVTATAESADHTWDAAVLLVPCDTSEDGEEEIELFGTAILGGDPRLPSQQGWELIKVTLAFRLPRLHSLSAEILNGAADFRLSCCRWCLPCVHHLQGQESLQRQSG